MWRGLVRMMWLPRRRFTVQPRASSALTTSPGFSSGSGGTLHRHLELPNVYVNRQRKPLFATDRETFTNRIADVLFRSFACWPLTDAARDGRTFRDKHSVFVLHEGDDEGHNRLLRENPGPIEERIATG